MNMSSKKFLVLFSVIALVFSACSKKEDEQPDPDSDPVIGSWTLRALYSFSDEESIDVSNAVCWKDTRFDVKANEFTLKLVVPEATGSSDCRSATQTAAWVNQNGTYYIVTESGNQPAGIALNDNNQTLQLNITADGEQYGLIFRK